MLLAPVLPTGMKPDDCRNQEGERNRERQPDTEAPAPEALPFGIRHAQSSLAPWTKAVADIRQRHRQEIAEGLRHDCEQRDLVRGIGPAPDRNDGTIVRERSGPRHYQDDVVDAPTLSPPHRRL